MPDEELVIFTCGRCGAKGNPPECDHFAQPWTPEQIAEAHRQLIDAGFVIGVRRENGTLTLSTKEDEMPEPEPDEYDASVNGFQDIGEAAARAGAALTEWAAQSEVMIEELVIKLTPEQRQHYLALVAGGSCKLNALVEIERSR